MFLSALELFNSRVVATPIGAWASESPCEGWTARDVVAHSIGNLRALRDCVEGGDFIASFGKPVEGEVAAAWRDVQAGAADPLRKASMLDALTVGGNSMPPSAIIDGLMRDLVIHTWDLARAVGDDERLPDELVVAATEAMSMVSDESRGPGFNGQVVPAPPGADAQTRLLALSGRAT